MERGVGARREHLFTTRDQQSHQATELCRRLDARHLGQIVCERLHVSWRDGHERVTVVCVGVVSRRRAQCERVRASHTECEYFHEQPLEAHRARRVCDGALSDVGWEAREQERVSPLTEEI